jgi:hypothetical protein
LYTFWKVWEVPEINFAYCYEKKCIDLIIISIIPEVMSHKKTASNTQLFEYYDLSVGFTTMPINIKRANFMHIFPLPNSTAKCKRVYIFLNYQPSTSVGLICSELHKNGLQNHSQYPVQQCLSGNHTHHKLFLMKWEMNVPFATHPYQSCVYFSSPCSLLPLSLSLSLVTWVTGVASCI